MQKEINRLCNYYPVQSFVFILGIPHVVILAKTRHTYDWYVTFIRITLKDMQGDMDLFNKDYTRVSMLSECLTLPVIKKKSMYLLYTMTTLIFPLKCCSFCSFQSCANVPLPFPWGIFKETSGIFNCFQLQNAYHVYIPKWYAFKVKGSHCKLYYGLTRAETLNRN